LRLLFIVFCASAALSIAAKAHAATCHGETATIVGTGGRDWLVGTPKRDVIVGLGRGDLIEADAGEDIICGGRGFDRIEAEDGDDIIRGGRGNDSITAGRGTDRITAGAGHDRANGEHGWDRFADGFGDDTYYGGRGWDSFFATSMIRYGNGDPPLLLSGGADSYLGGWGMDSFDNRQDDTSIEVNLEEGWARGDVIGEDTLGGVESFIAGKGNDLLIGNATSNVLDGGDGDDHIEGRGGNDSLVGWFGDDFLDGGDGSADRCHSGGPGAPDAGDVVVSCEEIW
jgi:Ca2+-binding RTX toxin-like protein